MTGVVGTTEGGRLYVELALGLMREIADKYKTVSVIGMAKNAGKTTALNYLIAQAEDDGLRLGISSTGRDGESEDVVTGTDKPRIFLPEDSLVVTASGIYELSDAGLEILSMTDHASPLGRILICRVAEAGFVQTAGPVTTAGQKEVCAFMLASGARIVLIDGAIDRKSIASPEASDGIILATGAVLSRSLTKVAEETGFAVEILGLPEFKDEGIRSAIEENPGSILVFGEDNVKMLPDKTGLTPGMGISREITAETRCVYLPGALTAGLIASVDSSLLGGLEFIVRDSTKVFIDRSSWRRFKARGLRVSVLSGVEIAAVTVNPKAPEGYSFDSRALIDAVKRVVGDLPVIDVRSE
jgi:hypothetical protein